MKHKLAVSTGLSVALALLSACDRKTIKEPPKPKAVAPNSSAAPELAVTDSAMVRFAAGRFMMGDKEQVDATPHEVGIRAFQMDTHLVTQAEYQKVMGSNPSRP